MHTPVLLNGVLNILDPQPGNIFIDATIDGGGHSQEIIKRIMPGGRLIGIDLDCNLLKIFGKKISQTSEVKLICSSYAKIEEIANELEITGKVNGVLFDLGFSSYHIDYSERGFSFMKSEPLDMRYDLDSGITASWMVNNLDEKELRYILRRYGEERFAGRIAKEIVRERKKEPIENTNRLVEVLQKAVGRFYKRSKIHFATRTFQALRIALNNELENLAVGLRGAINILAPAGKVAVISYHSLEDRVVKNIFKEEQSKGRIEILTKKPIVPSSEEISANPRARSAKLRAAHLLSVSDCKK